MSTSPKKPSSSGTVAPAPAGHMLGNKFLSFARSRLPVPNKPKARTHQRGFFNVAPVPFAPLVDTHVFQPPPPYSVHLYDSAEFLPVPHNTPEISGPTVVEDSLVLSASTAIYVRPIGLGIEGVEKGDGERFDGLGRLSGGFRATSGTSDALREQVQQMLTEHSRRRRTRASEQPTKRHDVFYASVEVQARDKVVNGMPTTVKIRIRRRSVASPTPEPKSWEGVRRATISSELKRAASLERRALLSETTSAVGWRM